MRLCIVALVGGVRVVAWGTVNFTNKPSQVATPKFHRADSALPSQAAGGVGVCACLLLHRRSAAGWAGCKRQPALVLFPYSIYILLVG